MGCKIGRQVSDPKTVVVWMKLAKNGRGLGVEASIVMLLGGVEVLATILDWPWLFTTVEET